MSQSCLFTVTLSLGLLLARALAAADTLTTPEWSTHARAVAAHDMVVLSPQRYQIKQPASDLTTAETISKLPATFVRNVSGLGSATTVISGLGLYSSGTQVSIEDFPIADPLTVGVNLALFPTAVLDGVEMLGPVHMAETPDRVNAATGGGRMNLRLLRAKQGDESARWSGSAFWGTANSAQAGVGLRRARKHDDYALGVALYGTQGDFNFRDPRTGGRLHRSHNDAFNTSVVARGTTDLGSSENARPGKLSLVEVFSKGNRTNPGSLDFPTRDHQEDVFNLLGLRWDAPSLFNKETGIFAKISNNAGRLSTRGESGSTDSKNWNIFSQLGAIAEDRGSIWATRAVVGAENVWDRVLNDDGIFMRHQSNVHLIYRADYGAFFLAPTLRQNFSTTDNPSTDTLAALGYRLGVHGSLQLSGGIQHFYPAIMAVRGYRNSAFTVLPNPGLKTQGDRLVELAWSEKLKYLHSLASVSYDRIYDRAGFSMVGLGAGQYVNQSDVEVLTGVVDVQVFPVSFLSLRSSTTLTRARNLKTMRELPYKPTVQGFESISISPIDRFSITVQEQFVTSRYFSELSTERLSAMAQTHLRADLNLGSKGLIYFKISNLLDVGGYENPGYVFNGRTFWAGYAFGVEGVQ